MRSINRVYLLGNLGSDVELRMTQAGKPVAHFNVATHAARKLEDGTWEERTEWHRVVVFGPQAEVCSHHLSKGAGVLVEGRISTRSYEDDQKARRFVTEVIAHEVHFLPRGERRAETVAQAEADLPF